MPNVMWIRPAAAIASRRRTSLKPEMSELEDLDADELHLVKTPANGFSTLLAKAVADEIDAAGAKPRTKNKSTKKEKTMKKTAKAPKSPLMKAAMKAARQGPQELGGLAFLVNRERVAKDLKKVAMAVGRNENNMGRAIRTASNPAVRRATTTAMNSFGRNPADALRAVIAGTMRAEEVPESVLAATRRQVDAHRQDSAADMIEIEGEIEALKGELAKALGERDAGAASRAEQISYQLSRKQLILGHRQGVI